MTDRPITFPYRLPKAFFIGQTSASGFTMRTALKVYGGST